MIRIRYNVFNETTLVSKPVVVSGQIVEVLLDLANQKFQVLNFDSKQVVSEGVGRDANQLKINAKKALKDLGASFGMELRKREKVSS